MTDVATTEVIAFRCAVGREDSTSYVCVDVAKEILATLPQSDGIVKWLDEGEFTDQQREQSLNLATRILEPLNWKGERCSCEQALEWPRSVQDCTCEMAGCSDIPLDIQMATAYLAAEQAYTGSLGSIGGGGGTGGNAGGGSGGGGGGVDGLEPFQEVTVGPINVKMKADAEFKSSNIWGWDALSPFLQSLLSKWIEGGAAKGIGQGGVSRGSVARSKARLPWQVPGTMSLRNGKVYPRYPGAGGW
jgi:hypothetical protein